MDETAKTLVLFLIGWAIYRYLKGQPLLPKALTPTNETLPAEASTQLTTVDEWEFIRGPEGGFVKVIHRRR